MATWSRDQSQAANTRAIKSGTSPGSKAMGNLQPLSEVQKRSIRRLNGTQMPFATKAVNGPEKPNKPDNEREYRAPVKSDWRLPRRWKRGTSGCRLDPQIRLAVENRKARRAAFLAGL